MLQSVGQVKEYVTFIPPPVEDLYRTVMWHVSRANSFLKKPFPNNNDGTVDVDEFAKVELATKRSKTISDVFLINLNFNESK